MCVPNSVLIYGNERLLQSSAHLICIIVPIILPNSDDINKVLIHCGNIISWSCYNELRLCWCWTEIDKIDPMVPFMALPASRALAELSFLGRIGCNKFKSLLIVLGHWTVADTQMRVVFHISKLWPLNSYMWYFINLNKSILAYMLKQEIKKSHFLLIWQVIGKKSTSFCPWVYTLGQKFPDFFAQAKFSNWYFGIATKVSHFVICTVLSNLPFVLVGVKGDPESKMWYSLSRMIRHHAFKNKWRVNRTEGGIPLNTWHNNNVVITLEGRHFDVITSKWRRFDVITTSLLRNVSAGMRLLVVMLRKAI